MRPLRQASRYAGPIWAGAVLILAVATLVVFTDVRRYNRADLPFAYDPAFSEIGSPDWRIEGDPAGVSAEGGTLRLRNERAGKSLTVRRAWRLSADGPRAFRLAATISTRDVTGGPAQVAFLADTDTRRGQLNTAHYLAVLHGSRGSARYVDRFEFPRGARTVELVVSLSGAKGEIAVSGLEIRALAERGLVGIARAGLQAAWGVVLILGCCLFWRGVDDLRAGLALLAGCGMGLLLLLLPQTGRNAVIDPLTTHLTAGLLDGEAVGDLGHFLIFALGGLLVRLSRRRDRAWVQLLLLAALAGVAELLQFLAELRSPDWWDAATNAMGGLAGWLPAMLWLRRQDGQLATQRRSSTTLPPQAAKQSRLSASQAASSILGHSGRGQVRRPHTTPSRSAAPEQTR